DDEATCRSRHRLRVLHVEEHANPLAGKVGVTFVQIDADGVAAMANSYGERGAAAGEGVEHQAVAPRVVAAVRPAEGLALSSGGTAARSGDHPDVPGADAVSVPVAPCPSADRFA